MTIINQSPYFDQARIVTLTNIVCDRIEELFLELGIRMNKYGKLYSGSCPIHGGNNPSGLIIYPDGHSLRGYWRCQTHHCEQTFKSTIVGFTRGVLSHEEKDWTKHGDKTFDFKATIDWLCKFIGQSIAALKGDTDDIEKRRFAKLVHTFGSQTTSPGISPVLLRSKLSIPAQYYIDRGFSPAILQQYDIGLCTDEAKPLYNRIVVPIYDAFGKWIVGTIGRSIYKQCSKCKTYHSEAQPCPQNESDRFRYSKWTNGKTKTGLYLFNWWKAASVIEKSKTVILVEGPMDVLRLEEAGIHNSLALFGTSLSDHQQILLEKSGAMNVVLLLDNDKAGEEGIATISKKLERSYHIYSPNVFGAVKDPGDMSVTEIKERIVPILDKVRM
jgi:5S rRNA maturation endonuclease (ribonuclease M5)